MSQDPFNPGTGAGVFAYGCPPSPKRSVALERSTLSAKRCVRSVASGTKR